MNKAEFLNGLAAGIKAAAELKKQALAAGNDAAYNQAARAESQLIATYKQAA